MRVIPQALNQDLGRVSVTEIVLDKDTPIANYDLDIADKTLIMGVSVCTEEKYEGGTTDPTMTMGDSADVDAFIANADITYGTAGAVANSQTIATPNAAQEGKYYPTGGTFRVAVTAKGDRTAGALRILVFSRTA